MSKILMIIVLMLSCVAQADEKIEKLEMPDGKVYHSVIITEHSVAYLSFMHKNGAARVKLRDCSKEIQRKYEYDAEKAEDYLAKEAEVEAKQRKRNAVRRAEHARKKREAAAKDKLIKLQKKIVKPMKFHIVQAQEDGAALCRIQVQVKATKVVIERGALSNKKKIVPYKRWVWLDDKDQWFYVRGIGSVSDNDVVGGYGMLTAENYSYSSVGAGRKTVPVVELRDKNGARLEP